MDSTMNFCNAEKISYVQIELEMIRQQYPNAEIVERKEGFELVVTGEVKSLANHNRLTKIHIIVPRVLFPSTDAHVVWPLGTFGCTPYGYLFTRRIAETIFHGDFVCSYDIIPGNFHFENSELYFDIQLNPNEATAVLFYADANTNSYAGPNKLVAFNFGDSKIYGLILPFYHLLEPHRAFADWNLPLLRKTMVDGLQKYSVKIANDQKIPR